MYVWFYIDERISSEKSRKYFQGLSAGLDYTEEPPYGVQAHHWPKVVTCRLIESRDGLDVGNPATVFTMVQYGVRRTWSLIWMIQIQVGWLETSYSVLISLLRIRDCC